MTQSKDPAPLGAPWHNLREAPANYNFARDVIDRWEAEDPGRSALFWIDEAGREERRSFSDIAAASRRLCNILNDMGVQRGDVVIVMLGRQIAWWETFTACLRFGAIFSPATAQLSAKDLEYRINAAGATCLVTDATNTARLEDVLATCPSLVGRILVDGQRDGWISYDEALAAASDDFATADTSSSDPAVCFFTSGTTGYPKMCLHRHDYALGHYNTGARWLNLWEGDLHWNISDTGWGKAAWSSFFGPWICGATVFVSHDAGFNPQRTLEILDKYPITTMCGAPTIYRMLVAQDLSHYRFAHLKNCVGAGEPLNPEVIESWRQATAITIRDGYGQTETALLCANFPGMETRPGSMGKPAPGIDLAIVDDDGEPVPDSREGNIAVQVNPTRPLGLFLEYKGDPAKTAATFVGDYYLTGDRGMRDEDGYFWFIGRGDDVILSSGYRIGPFEVESALIEHPAVLEAAVVSSPDDTRGEVVKAFVILAAGYAPGDELAQELKDHVKRVTAPYKYPRRIEFVDGLPKTVSGKIRRIELREKEWAVRK